jgi:hypothetical protein
MILGANKLEKALETGTGYLDCFKGIDQFATKRLSARYGRFKCFVVVH